MLKRGTMAVVVALTCVGGGVGADAAAAASSRRRPSRRRRRSSRRCRPTATPGRRPRRPMATPACGSCRPARFCRRGKWSFSVYRVNFDYEEGFTDVSNWPVTFGVGLGDRAELFGAFHVVRRIDRDVRPIFTSNAESGGHGQRLSVGASGLVGQSARRPLDRREDQPRRAVAQPERRAGIRAARDGQDPDREG